MSKHVCSKCVEVFDGPEGDDRCPECGSRSPNILDVENGDLRLKEELARVLAERKEAGLDGLVGGLDAVIINTEPDLLKAASEELLRSTGHEFGDVFQDPQYRAVVLKMDGSSNILVRSRLDGENPFRDLNLRAKSKHLPNTRLEALVFRTTDLEKYVSIQETRGVSFLTDDIVEAESYSFIQTAPSRFTGNSFGFIQWHGKGGDYRTLRSEPWGWDLSKPDLVLWNIIFAD